MFLVTLLISVAFMDRVFYSLPLDIAAVFFTSSLQ
jgi:hypothetical protein